MIQDTRYTPGLDDLPNLRIYGYHTYHRTMDEDGHGMVTIIKHTIPSEEAEQIHLRDGTETLSTRIWLNNKPSSLEYSIIRRYTNIVYYIYYIIILLHNIYRVDRELDITTPLTREPRSIMAGDFNHIRAGRLLNK